MFESVLFYGAAFVGWVVVFLCITYVVGLVASSDIFTEQHMAGAMIISLITVGCAGFYRDLPLKPLFFFAVMVALGWLVYRIRDRARKRYLNWDAPDMKAHIIIVLGSFALTGIVALVFGGPISMGLLLAAMLVYAISWLFMFPM